MYLWRISGACLCDRVKYLYEQIIFPCKVAEKIFNHWHIEGPSRKMPENFYLFAVNIGACYSMGIKCKVVMIHG